MFRTVADFQKAWEYETECTLKMLRALSDASLQQAVTPHDRTLGRIAWHVVTSVPEMMNRTGLTLAVLVRHQAHHRGQMTVLMRQAGLKVPGVYGPAREEWAEFGMQPPAA